MIFFNLMSFMRCRRLISRFLFSFFFFWIRTCIKTVVSKDHVVMQWYRCNTVVCCDIVVFIYSISCRFWKLMSWYLMLSFFGLMLIITANVQVVLMQYCLFHKFMSFYLFIFFVFNTIGYFVYLSKYDIVSPLLNSRILVILLYLCGF